MGKAETLLYRKALKILKSYHNSGIPFTGIYGTSLVNWELRGESSLKAWFIQSGNALNNLQLGTACLGLAEEQLKILENSEEDTRKGMLEWENARMEVIRHKTSQNERRTSIFGCQIGMETISRQINGIIDPFDLEPRAKVTIENIAEEMSVCLPDISSLSERERLEVFVDGMYRRLKYKYEPFEWLYEGLKPILMENVLYSKKGTPAALSLFLSAIGEKIGLMLLPMPNIQTHQANFIDNEIYSSFLDSLPSDAALRLKSKTQSIIPEPDTWFLRLDNEDMDTPLYINCKKGEVMDINDMLEKNEILANMTLAEWRQQSILRTWSGLVNLAVQAHQRRGESDLVAHWIYIKLALDPLASEWERAISPPELFPSQS